MTATLGYKYARTAVWIGAVVLLFRYGVLQITSTSLGAASIDSAVYLGCIIPLILGDYANNIIHRLLAYYTYNTGLWVRCLISTCIGQFIMNFVWVAQMQFSGQSISSFFTIYITNLAFVRIVCLQNVPSRDKKKCSK